MGEKEDGMKGRRGWKKGDGMKGRKNISKFYGILGGLVSYYKKEIG